MYMYLKSEMKLSNSLIWCPLFLLFKLSRRILNYGYSYHRYTEAFQLNRKQASGGGGGIRPQAGSFLCCAETVSSRKLKRSDFYYILIRFYCVNKPVPWGIYCCHSNAIVEEHLVSFCLKSVENCIFSSNRF